MIFMHNRATDKVKKWIEDIREDKNSRYRDVHRNIEALSNEIGDYFKAKAKDRKYFYGR